MFLPRSSSDTYILVSLASTNIPYTLFTYLQSIHYVCTKFHLCHNQYIETYKTNENQTCHCGFTCKPSYYVNHMGKCAVDVVN